MAKHGMALHGTALRGVAQGGIPQRGIPQRGAAQLKDAKHPDQRRSDAPRAAAAARKAHRTVKRPKDACQSRLTGPSNVPMTPVRAGRCKKRKRRQRPMRGATPTRAGR